MNDPLRDTLIIITKLLPGIVTFIGLMAACALWTHLTMPGTQRIYHVCRELLKRHAFFATSIISLGYTATLIGIPLLLAGVLFLLLDPLSPVMLAATNNPITGSSLGVSLTWLGLGAISLGTTTLAVAIFSPIILRPRPRAIGLVMPTGQPTPQPDLATAEEQEHAD